MKTPSPGLAAQLAQLHHAPLGREKCAWVPAAVHDLIITWLTRIFASLEQLVRLWQAGQLPPPPIRTAVPRTDRQNTPRHVRPPASRRRAIRRATHRGRTSLACHVPAGSPELAPRQAIAPPARPRPARDPPPARAKLRGENPPLRDRATVPVVITNR